jgi:23S rRNA (cytidine1920-2'-O)/16S rRNA (cytidine1409-2'-O)-methyltransferase
MPDSAQPTRLDKTLVTLGRARSRAIAAALIDAELVTVDGKVARKASELVFVSNVIHVEQRIAEPVSRAGTKLESAIEHLTSYGVEILIAGKRCLDIGASTGGFTSVLLARGAAEVIALDVGHSQLRIELREDPRVIVMEGVNARYLESGDLPFAPDLVTCDVSFISVTQIFDAIVRVANPGATLLLLVKPQFEVGKGNLGKGGIVTDGAKVHTALENVRASAHASGIDVVELFPSGVVGEHGNQEYFLFGSVMLKS